MIGDVDLPYGNDHSHAGTRYAVTDAENPWALPVGAELIEDRRGEFWDNAPLVPVGHCWVWLTPIVPGTPPERGFIGHLPADVRARPVLLEVLDEGGSRTWAVAWLAVVQ